MGETGMKTWGTWALYPYTEDELNAARAAHGVARSQVDAPPPWHELEDQIKDGFLAMAQAAIRAYESSDNGTREYWTKLAMDTGKMLDEVVEQRDHLQNEVRVRQDRENGTVGTKAERDMLSAWRTMLYDVDMVEQYLRRNFPNAALTPRRAVWSAMDIIVQLQKENEELRKRIATARKRHESSERNTERQRTREVREELRRLSVELTLRDSPVPMGTKVVDHALFLLDQAWAQLTEGRASEAEERKDAIMLRDRITDLEGDVFHLQEAGNNLMVDALDAAGDPEDDELKDAVTAWQETVERTRIDPASR